MPTYAKIKADALILNPVSSQTDNNALFIDAGDSFKLKTNDQHGAQSEVSKGSSAVNYQVKEMEAFSTIRVGKTISKRPDGRIMEAESDGAGAQQPVGIALSAFPTAGDLGNVLLFGPNADGVLVGLGFAPGDEIFVGETTGGYVNDIAPFTGNNDSIIKIGVADCTAGVASSEATDLILIPHVIARP